MIQYMEGNLLRANAEALVNTVNCVGVMGKGIALQFKKAYPENYQYYRRACQSKKVKPGSMFIFNTNRLTPPRYLINFPTKRHWRNKSRLEDIRLGLNALVKEVKRLGIRSIAIPPLGCGNGGLDWSEVKPLIITAFKPLPEINVLLFAPHGAPKSQQMVVASQKPGLTRARALFIQLMDQYLTGGAKMGLLEVQKLAYFLQISGERLRLQYKKQQFGPYAHNLNHVLRLLDGHFIQGYGDGSQKKVEMSLLPQASNDAQAFLADARQAHIHLERVKRLIQGYETPRGLELLATVHWVTQEEAQAAREWHHAAKLVHEWNPRKQRRFDKDSIRQAWQRLSNEGWIEY